MDSLDSTLVISHEISKYMNQHPETTQMQELSCAIEALPDPRDRLRVQMKCENELNDVVGDMYSEERKTYLARWDELRKTKIITFYIHDGGHYVDKYAPNEFMAARLLWKFCQSRPVWTVDWLPEDVSRHYAYLFNLKPFGQLYTSIIPYASWPEDFEKCIMMRLGGNKKGYLTEEDTAKIMGPQYEKPSLDTCLKWIQKEPLVILNGHCSVQIESLPVCERLV
jgi:hypothetical protein